MKITSQISRKKLFGLTTGILVSLASSGINTAVPSVMRYESSNK